MKRIIFLSFLLISGNLTFAANSTVPVVKKSQTVKKSQIAKNILPKKSNFLSPNIIPITTLDDNHLNADGISRHEPCAATRMTPTLLITAAHCFLVASFSSGSRVNADIFETDDGVQGLLFANPKKDTLVIPNAQIFLYRPKYTDPNLDPSFDFAVVVLDRELKYNQASINKIAEQAASLGVLPENFRNNVKSMIMEQMKQKFEEQSAKYTQFINKQLDRVALLTMTPEGVMDELKGRSLKSYFWNGTEWSTKRDSLVVLSNHIDEEECVAPNSSHMMLFQSEEEDDDKKPFPAGVSGSPIFDIGRKLVVSVASGVAANGDNTGGLIDDTLCQWVKKHDSKAKCFVRHEKIVKNEKETPSKYNQGAHKPTVAKNKK